MERNITSHDYLVRVFDATEIIQIILLIPVLIIGTVGNQLAIYVFGWKKRNTRKRFETLLLLLAICDFFASLVAPPTFIYAISTHFNQWHFGYGGCKLFLSIGPLNVTISHGILVLISYERYRSVANPLGEAIRRSFFIVWLLCTLTMSLIIVAPYTYSLQIVSDQKYGTNTCNPSKKNHRATQIFALGNVLRDVFASISIITFGILTAKRMNAGRVRESQNIIKKREKNTTKATKMLIIVAGLFSICVIPLDLFQVIQYSFFHKGSTSEHYSDIVTYNTFLHILQMSNSATNIIVYSRMHRDFTRGVVACSRKGNDIIRESISRVTFRSIRSLSNGTRRSSGIELNTMDVIDENKNNSSIETGITDIGKSNERMPQGTPTEKMLLGNESC